MTTLKELLARPVTIRVYLAGKIAKNDWRHQLFPDLRGALEATGDEIVENPRQVRGRGMFAYAGPYFLSCDHGGWHGDGTHGLGVGTGNHDRDGIHNSHGCAKCCPDGPVVSQERVVRLCQSHIRQSDVMFVWLDDSTAYGTVAEIGYAIGLGIGVWLYEPPETDIAQLYDMWFAREMATKKFTADNAIEAFKHFERNYGPRVKTP